MSAGPNMVGQGELARALGLASLDVAAYDEGRLAQSVLDGARMKAATGVSTSARLSTVLSLLSKVRARVSELDNLNSSAATAALDDERLRLQLLERVAKARRADSLSGLRGTATGTMVVALIPGGPVCAAGTTDSSAGTGAALFATEAGGGGAAPRDYSQDAQRAPPVGGYVVPKGMVVTFASRIDAGNDDATSGEDTTQQRRSRTTKKAPKRKIPMIFKPSSEHEDGEVLDQVSYDEVDGGCTGDEVDDLSEAAESSGREALHRRRRQRADSESIGSDDLSDASHERDSIPTKRGRASRAELAAAAPTDDMDPDNFDARQLRFQVELHALCKKLRSEASASARIAGVDDPLALAAARDAAAPKASVQAMHGPGPSVELAGGLSLPYIIASSLLPYQLIGVRWLSGLRSSRTGGVLGDEMGLGKTVQIAALLGAVAASGEHSPTLIVCPATLVAHWVRELTQWWPPLRVLILSGGSTTAAKGTRARVIAETLTRSCVLVTTYEGLRVHAAALTNGVRWGYAILDEGHRIRNPEAAVTIAAKGLRTVNRLVLSGAPVQNSLAELWSLFDFCTPGRLGTLPVFEAQFSAPIAAGGWTHATPLQSHTAYQCALSLRALIEPFLLRRLKKDVNAQLPSKTEQVLFCRLTPSQRAAYADYLRGAEVSRVLDGREHAFKAVTTLRKLANDPGLLDSSAIGARSMSSGSEATRDAALRRSGKLRVLAQVLALWHTEGRRCLVFTQGTKMLDTIEGLIRTAHYTYLRMDGTTAMGSRQALVDSFNGDASRFVFLLTTRVGGVGVNLIGADRVLIFDPDWNPSTDLQARERAWRLGQRRHVTIYRLIAAGTIEEKVYQRQIFKTALTARILTDPKAKRLFNYRDMRELFTLVDDPRAADVANDEGEGDTRGAVVFSGGGAACSRGGGKGKKRARGQTDSYTASDHDDWIVDDVQTGYPGGGAGFTGDIVSREAFQAPDDSAPAPSGGSGSDDGDAILAARPGATLLRSVIDARGANLAPSLDGLSVNQRTAIISHGSRYVRSALRALQPSSVETEQSTSLIDLTYYSDPAIYSESKNNSLFRHLIVNRCCQTAVESATVSRTAFICLGALAVRPVLSLRLRSEPGFAVGARSLIIRDASNAFTKAVPRPDFAMPRFPIEALQELPIAPVRAAAVAALLLPPPRVPVEPQQTLRLLFRRRAMGGAPDVAAAIAAEAAAAEAQPPSTLPGQPQVVPSSIDLLAALSQRAPISLVSVQSRREAAAMAENAVKAARAAILSAVANVTDRQGRTFGGLLGVF